MKPSTNQANPAPASTGSTVLPVVITTDFV